MEIGERPHTGEANQGTWMGETAFEPRTTVRLALLGAGGRGRGLLRSFLATGTVEVAAIYDSDREASLAAGALVKEVSESPFTIYGASDRELQSLLGRGDIDLAIVATPWEDHTPMAVAAMQAGVHVGVEVPAGTTLRDCWELVRVSERTRRHCVILENACYEEADMLVLNMIRDGVFGEVLHAEGAYIHDLRELLFSDQGEGRWRRRPHEVRDGNLYPTHAVGPVSNWVGINRGDRYDRLVSMSSAQRGLDLWRSQHLPGSSDKQKERYVCGDVNTSLLRTAKGVTVMVQHDVVNPSARDARRNLIGTKGAVRGFSRPAHVYIEGMAEERGFALLDDYRERYQNRLWREFGSRAGEIGGHGGMDFIMAARLVECMRRGIAPDIDVYDTASWSAVGPLSEASVSGGSKSVGFPDFTRGHWERIRENLT